MKDGIKKAELGRQKRDARIYFILRQTTSSWAMLLVREPNASDCTMYR